MVGNGAALSGIRFFNDLPGAITLAYIRIDSVEVSGYGRDGIEVGSWSGASGYRDVQIVNATAHDNVRTGIFVYAQQPNVHRSVTVTGSRAFNNFGIAGTGTNSGSGIILAGVNGGVLERSVAHANGIRCDAPGRPIGIWAYDSTHIDIATTNRTATVRLAVTAEALISTRTSRTRWSSTTTTTRTITMAPAICSRRA